MDTNLLIQILLGLSIMNAITTVAVLPSQTRMERKLGETMQVIGLVQHSQEESTRNLMGLIEKLIERIADRRGY